MDTALERQIASASRSVEEARRLAYHDPSRIGSLVEQISVLAETDVVFEPGFTTDGDGDDAGLAAAAVAAARDADVAVLFLGVPDGAESEGFDRTGWELPRAQLDLLAAVLEVNPRTAVVLSHGAVLDLAEVVAAPAVVDGQLLGEGGGAAVADILYGLDDPSGRLAETVPLRLQDTPAYLDFPGELLHVRYGEGVFIGHRYYDARGLEVRFPFGHGLSYTTTEFTDVSAVVTDDGIPKRRSAGLSGEAVSRRQTAEANAPAAGAPAAPAAPAPGTPGANAGAGALRRHARQAGERLGESLAILVDLFNPECIILGGFFPRCRELLEHNILPLCRYFAYIQVVEQEQNLWHEYAALAEEASQVFAMRKATEVSQIYPVFRDLFRKEGVAK